MTPYGAPPGAPQTPQILESFLAQRGPLSAPELIGLVGPVMDQVATLHSAGQHHGNLSPDTITVTPTPAGTLAAWLPPTTPLAAGAWPLYQSPEQLYAGGQVGYWSDIYALTCILHRALTGQPPFAGASAEEVRLGHLQAQPPSLTALRPDLAPELDAALHQGLAKAPADRHASVQALRQAVEAAAMAAPPPVAAYAPAAGLPPDLRASHDCAVEAARSAYADAMTAHAAAGSPPPPTQIQPTPMPGAKSSGPKVMIIAGLAGAVMVMGAVVTYLATGSRKSKDESHTSATATDKPPPSRARPVARSGGMRPAAAPADPTPLALPGVDDKIKTTPSPAITGSDAELRYKMRILLRPWRGAKDAVVVIALWGDFQCPWCKRVNGLVDSLVKKYPKDLKVVWFDFPLRFHNQAMNAAIAAQSVFRQRGNKAFWQYQRKVFANARSISPGKLADWAKEVGADGTRVASDLEAPIRRRMIERRMDHAKRVGVRGTPTLFVNGIRYKARRTMEGFSKMIDAERDRAGKAIQAGKTTRQGYHAYLMRNARLRQPAKKDPGGKIGKRPPRKRRTLDPKAIYRVPVFEDDPWKGAKRPLVTIVLWSDFECPYCKYLACTMEEVLRKYPKTVRLVYRHHPLSFHKNAMPAAEAVEAARAQKGRKGFWRMYARVFPLDLCPRRNSKVTIREWLRKIRGRQPQLTRAHLDRFAKKVRLRMSRFAGHMDNHTHRARIQRQAAAARALGARGTPAVFVNGRYVRGFRDFAKMKVVVDEEVTKARRLVKGGVSRRKVYDHIIARGVRSLVYLN